MCMFHTSIKYILLHTCMCVWEHACLAAWHWLMVMISLESLSLVSNISVKCLLYFSLEMTINFYYPTLEFFFFHLPNLLLTQNLVYPTLFSSVPPPAINNERSLRRQVKSLLHDKRKEFFQNLPDLLKTSSKKFWSVFKSVSKHSNIPNKVSWSKDPTPHIAADNPADIANVFNRYFFSVFNTACPMPRFTSSPRPRKL